MRFYAMGIDATIVQILMENGYDIVFCRTIPDREALQNQALLLGSSAVPVAGLSELRKMLDHTELIYLYQQRGIAGWQHAAAICNSLGIRFLRPGISHESLLEAFQVWYRQPKQETNIIGVFGSSSGVGVTRFSATLAEMAAKEGRNVVLLGLNLYSSGWDSEPSISLDRWRQRLAAGVLQTEDFSQLVKVSGFSYLPGNEDILAVLDYQENEIIHLLELASRSFDVVIADFGSIPESAAWLAGVQHSAIRCMVAQPNHHRRLSALMRLSETIGVGADSWFLVSSRATQEDPALKTLSEACGMLPLCTIPYKGLVRQFTLPLEPKEYDSLRKACQPLFSAVGMEAPVSKRKGWF